ncbi:hypothetical protein [Nostoc sp. NIES-3756]|nr:hypothetical protein [Nostoc sp. NIES-3756]
MNSQVYQTVILGGGFTGLFTALPLFCHFPSILNKRIKRKNSGRQAGQWM